MSLLGTWNLEPGTWNLSEASIRFKKAGFIDRYSFPRRAKIIISSVIHNIAGINVRIVHRPATFAHLNADKASGVSYIYTGTYDLKYLKSKGHKFL